MTQNPPAVEILQKLVRMDTTNPPGNEIICIQYLERLLDEAGIQTTTLARDPQRPNLLARLPGRGDAPPFLMHGHVDVVTTAHQDWDHPPFSGDIVDGFMWGRGTIDDKGGVAMMVAAMLQAQAEKLELPGDVLLAVLSDEEAGGDYGAKFLVEEHPAQFEGIRYAVGEGGGPSIRVGGRKFYTIMLAEKQICWIRARLRGPAGHGSMPKRGGAMAKTGAMLTRLDQKRLPVHITPVTRQMIQTLSHSLPFPTGLVLRQLLSPALTNGVLGLLGKKGALFSPLLRNTVSPNIVRGGDKINVIPGEVTVELDGRLLPGYTQEDMLRELGQLLGDQVELEVLRYEPNPGEGNPALYELLADVLKAADPEGIPLPILLSGVTDARYFAQLGIHTCGFMPMDLSEGLIDTVHAANERIPVESIGFGASAILALLRRLGEITYSSG